MPSKHMSIVFFGGLIGLAVAHLFGDKNAAVITARVTVLYWVYRLMIWFCAWNIFGFLAAVLLMLLFVFALKGNDIVKKALVYSCGIHAGLPRY